MSIFQRTYVPALAASKFHRASFFGLPSLNRVCERQACFGASNTAGIIKTIHRGTRSLSRYEVFPPGSSFTLGLATKKIASLSSTRGSFFHQDGNVRGSMLGTRMSTSGSYLACRPACSATEMNATKDGLRGKNARLALRVDSRDIEVLLVWLRDHCRCETCYNAVTNQKMVDTCSLGNDLAVLETKLEGDTLNVTWQDGHASQYSLKWLDNNFHCPVTRVERDLWDAARWTEQQLPKTGYGEHMNSEEGLRNTLESIVKYGFCLIEGVPGTVEGTEKAASRIGLLYHTFYGVVDTVDSSIMSHEDTAYTNMAIGPHTDTSYFSAPCGLQVFHVHYHDGKGGKTVLVDGFNQAEKLRKANPSYFRTLATTKVPHDCIEPSRTKMYATDTTLTTDERTDDLIRLRYNPYDRAPLSNIAPDDIPAFYDSCGALADYINSEGSQLWMQLKP